MFFSFLLEYYQIFPKSVFEKKNNTFWPSGFRSTIRISLMIGPTRNKKSCYVWSSFLVDSPFPVWRTSKSLAQQQRSVAIVVFGDIKIILCRARTSSSRRHVSASPFGRRLRHTRSTFSFEFPRPKNLLQNTIEHAIVIISYTYHSAVKTSIYLFIFSHNILHVPSTKRVCLLIYNAYR